MTFQPTFDALAETTPGCKWQARWRRFWPAYRAWFEARGGQDGPDRAACETALARDMPSSSRSTRGSPAAETLRRGS